MLFTGIVVMGTRRLNELSLRLRRLNVIFLGLICSFTLNVPVLFYIFLLQLILFLLTIDSSKYSVRPTPSVTFKNGADMFPDGDAAAAVELAESQLHVEERHPSKHCHQQVGQQKGT